MFVDTVRKDHQMQAQHFWSLTTQPCSFKCVLCLKLFGGGQDDWPYLILHTEVHIGEAFGFPCSMQYPCQYNVWLCSSGTTHAIEDLAPKMLNMQYSPCWINSLSNFVNECVHVCVYVYVWVGGVHVYRVLTLTPCGSHGQHL